MLKTIQTKLRVRGWSFIPAVALFCLAITSTSCLTNNMNVSTGVSSGVDAAAPINGVGSGDGIMTLSRVVKSSADPNLYLDLIGRSDGEIGQYCTGESPTGESSCTCNFSFTNASGDEESFDVPTVYREANMIRCDYTELKKKGLPTTKIRIHTSPTASDAYSNAITYYFTGTGTTQDYSSPDTYARVVRYQCQDVIFIPYLLDNNIYDPFLSTDPQYSYAFNYYTTNMGGTIEEYATRVSAKPEGIGWNCPATPIDTALNQEHETQDEFDLRIFSTASLDSKQIYPVTGAIDRHNFYLAKSASTMFNVPLNVFKTPGIQGTIGYAAASISTADGEETCPDLSKPEGYDWVKLWQFRGSMESRKRPASTAILGIQSIACNPDKWPSGVPVYSACNNSDNFSARVYNAGSTAPADNACFTRSTSGVTGYPALPDLWTLLKAIPSNPLNLDNTPGTASPTDTALALENIDNENSQSDIVFTVSPTDIHYKDISGATDQGKPYIPYRFYSRAKCPDSDPDNPANSENCKTKIPYHVENQDITDDKEDVEDPGRTRRFPLCVLQKVP